MTLLLAEVDSYHWFLQIIFGILLSVTGSFLVLLVLVQRGRGGGLSGAFGGMGGQSAFGTKAGDVFTRITIGAAIFWILLCLASVMFLPTKNELGSDTPSATSTTTPATKPADKKEAGETKTTKPSETKTGDKKPSPKKPAPKDE